jgi:hypothetical protein
MRWLNKLERKFGKFAIHNFILSLTILMACVALLDFFATYTHSVINIANYLNFDRDLILQGQVWRVISFIIMPPPISILFIVFVLYMFFIFGKSLEDEWGSFKLNIYYLIGIIGAIIGGFITGSTTNTYLSLSIFLAFAVINPDYRIFIFFVLPVKVKYLAYIDALFYVLSLIIFPIEYKIACVFSIVNFLVFFGPEFIIKQKNKRSYRSVQNNFKKEMKKYRQ